MNKKIKSVILGFMAGMTLGASTGAIAWTSCTVCDMQYNRCMARATTSSQRSYCYAVLQECYDEQGGCH